ECAQLGGCDILSDPWERELIARQTRQSDPLTGVPRPGSRRASSMGSNRGEGTLASGCLAKPGRAGFVDPRGDDERFPSSSLFLLPGACLAQRLPDLLCS